MPDQGRPVHVLTSYLRAGFTQPMALSLGSWTRIRARQGAAGGGARGAVRGTELRGSRGNGLSVDTWTEAGRGGLGGLGQSGSAAAAPVQGLWLLSEFLFLKPKIVWENA